MGSSWSGFVPQNDIIRLQWAMLEASQREAAAKLLAILLGGKPGQQGSTPEEEPEEFWEPREMRFCSAKDK